MEEVKCITSQLDLYTNSKVIHVIIILNVVCKVNVLLFLEISLLLPSKIRNYFMFHIQSENGRIKWIWVHQYS